MLKNKQLLASERSSTLVQATANLSLANARWISIHKMTRKSKQKVIHTFLINCQDHVYTLYTFYLPSNCLTFARLAIASFLCIKPIASTYSLYNLKLTVSSTHILLGTNKTCA